MSERDAGAAFASDLAAHAEFVRRVARGLLAGEADADDVAQETLLAALERRPARDDGGSLRAWLATVARNAAREWARRGERRRRREERSARPEAVPSPLDTLDRQRTLRHLTDAILALPEPYRSTILARYYDALAPAAIAARSGIPAATVRTHLKRGLERLRESLDARHGGDRERWALALAPLVPISAGAVLLGGGLIVGKWTGSVAAALAVAAAVGTIALFMSNDAERERGSHSPASRAAEPVAAAPAPSETVAPPTAAASKPNAAGSPRLGLALTGRVVDSAGTPLPGVPVGLEREGAAASSAPALTDDAGRFALDGPAPDGAVVVTLRARPAHLCDAVATRALRSPEDGEFGDLVAHAGGSVSGRVTTSGSPLAGARVTAVPSIARGSGVALIRDVPEGPSGRVALTDDGGVYRIDGLPPGACFIRFAAPGCADVVRPGVRVGQGEVTEGVDLDVDLDRAVAGRVVDPDGAPIPNVSVRLYEIGTPSPGESTYAPDDLRTDAEGRFAFRGLVGGPYYVLLRAPGFLSPKADSLTPGPEERMLTMQPSGTIEVTVIDAATRTAVANASVGVDDAAATVTAGGGGVFLLANLPSGPVRVTAAAPGYASVLVGDLEAPPATGRRVEVALERGAEIAGEVRDAAGAPIEGALVSAPFPPVASARTDAAGRFTLKGLASGNHELVARHPAYQAKSTPPIAVAAEEPPSAEPVVIVLEETGTIAGLATKADGSPLEGAHVTARFLADPASSRTAIASDARAVANGRGEFEVRGLATGPYALRVESDAVDPDRIAASASSTGPEPGEIVADVRAGESTWVELRERLRGRIRGTVTDAGAAAAGVSVSLASLPDDATVAFEGASAATDDAGEFAFDGVEAGTYILRVKPPGAARSIRRDLTVGEGETRELAIALPGGAIEGTVVDAATREPMAGVAVAVSRPGVREPMVLKAAPGGGITGLSAPSFEERFLTDASGRYRFTHVEPGEYAVAIEGGGAAPARRDGVTVLESRSPAIVDFAATRGATIEVRYESDGPAMPAVLAAIEPESVTETTEARHAWRPMKTIVFRDLAPGAYRITVRDLPDSHRGETRAVVAAGETATVSVRLERR